MFIILYYLNSLFNLIYLLFLDNSLFHVATLQDIKIYTFDGLSLEISSYAAQFSKFINILKVLADVFELTPNSIRIFSSDNSNLIAFNRQDRALYFNLKVYIASHHVECENKLTINAMTYW